MHSLDPHYAHLQLDWEVRGLQAAQSSNLKASTGQRMRFSLVIERVESDPVPLYPLDTAIIIQGPSREQRPQLQGSTADGESQGFAFS